MSSVQLPFKYVQSFLTFFTDFIEKSWARIGFEESEWPSPQT